MATFYCSVLFPPSRFVSRVPIQALCMYDAFLKMQDKYKALDRFDPLYLVEYRRRYRYYNIHGEVIP